LPTRIKRRAADDKNKDDIEDEADHRGRIRISSPI
jgi:hypothetical protein